MTTALETTTSSKKPKRTTTAAAGDAVIDDSVTKEDDDDNNDKNDTTTTTKLLKKSINDTTTTTTTDEHYPSQHADDDGLTTADDTTTKKTITTPSQSRLSPYLHLLYLTLLLLRLACIFLPGYIHPDEFFQGGQELFFNCLPSSSQHDDFPTVVSWEWDPSNAIRSIVPPRISILLPLMQLFTESSETITTTGSGGWEILIIPRFFLILLSIVIIDTSLKIMLSSYGNKKEVMNVGLMMISTSWPCLVMGCRPFSNNWEGMVLACLLALASQFLETVRREEEDNGKWTMRVMLYLMSFGVICAIGIFVRFTFVIFACPVVVMLLWNVAMRGGKKSVRRVVVRACLAVIGISIGFIPVAMAFVSADSQYYRGECRIRHASFDNSTPSCATIGGDYYITPLNAFLYNSRVDNLQSHGLHPRITHIFVNMPLLFGPLAFFFYYDLFFGGKTIRGQQKQSSSSSSSVTFTMCRWVIIISLIGFSCAPHQEPRFLLPLLVPLVVIAASSSSSFISGSNSTSSASLKFIWILFNMAGLFLFGFFHQGGIIPSLLQIGRQQQQLAAATILSSTQHRNNKPPPRAIIYFHTYMPPTFLTRKRRSGLLENTDDALLLSSSSCHNDCNIIDLKGEPIERLRDTLSKTFQYCVVDDNSKNNEQDLGNQNDNVSKEQSSDDPLTRRGHNNDHVVYVITPPAAIGDDYYDDDNDKNIVCSPKLFGLTDDDDDYSCRRIWDYHPHLTTEDLPPWNEGMDNVVSYWKKMKLVMYEVSKNNGGGECYNTN